MGEHDNKHKIIDINDKVSLNNYNISYEEMLPKSEEIFKKIKDLKVKLEKEIEKINNSHQKVMEEISSYFEAKRTEISQREEDVKLKLDEKVTKVKEELEKQFQISTEIEVFYERLFKGIKNYEKKDNNIEIKKLYYISEINQIDIKAKGLVILPIKNIEINYNNEDNLSYKEYYFNGIPIPKDIKINKSDKINISWSLDEIKIPSFDNKKIKYIIELNDGESNEELESSKNSIDFNDYKYDTEYKVKVRILYEDNYGEWSILKEFKTAGKPEKNNFGGLFGNNPPGGLFGNNQGGNIFGNNAVNLFGNNQGVRNLFGNN